MGFASIGCWLDFALVMGFASITLMGFALVLVVVAGVGLVVGLWFSGVWCFNGGSGWFHGDSMGEVKQKKFFG